jgi:membrane peptidoglycan carboxypeptidase
MCTIRVAEKVGIPTVIDTLRKAGISANLTPTLSLALGSPAVTPLELAAAYGTLARGGIYIKPWTIRRIEDVRGRSAGTTVPRQEQVFPIEPVSWLVDVLQDVVIRGTGTQARLAKRPVAGKTGTADKAKDIWFVGFTSDMVTAVWGGGDEKKVVAKNVTGGTVMARIFRLFNEEYYKANPLPVGSLLTGAYNDVNQTATTTAKGESHSNDVPYYDSGVGSQGQYQQTTQAGAAATLRSYGTVPSPSGGTATKVQKGVTDYQWNR